MKHEIIIVNRCLKYYPHPIVMVRTRREHTNSNTTVTLPQRTVGRRSVSKILGNRATSADCRSTSAPILAYFFIGRRLFCWSTQVKSFVGRSADFQGFCHRWSVGRWSPDDRPTFGGRFEKLTAWYWPIIGRQSADYHQTVGWWHFIKEPLADRRQISAVIRPMITRPLADNKMWFVLYFNNAYIGIMYNILIMHLCCFGIQFPYICCQWQSSLLSRQPQMRKSTQ